MPEGLLTAGGISGAVMDDPDREPDPTAEAPRGWAWQRKTRSWAPRQRGPFKYQADPGAAAAPAAAADEGWQRDPDPRWMRDDGTPPPRSSDDGRLPFDEVPQQVKDDIAGLAGLIGIPVLSMLQSADPYCGTALAQSYEGIVDAALPLLCRSSKIVKYFTEDKADWLLWGKLALALKPVAQAVLEHHVFRTVEVVRDDSGRPQVIRRIREDRDHLTPQPQPEYNYAA